MREARKKPKEHKELDTMKPFSYFDLGTAKDPCFGKLYSVQAKECKRCGDCETCAIVTSQKGFLKQIEKENSKAPYLDVQEGELVDSQNEAIQKLMIKKAEKFPDKKLSISKLAAKMVVKYNLNDRDQTYMEQRCITMAEKSSKLELNKNQTKYNLVP